MLIYFIHQQICVYSLFQSQVEFSCLNGFRSPGLMPGTARVSVLGTRWFGGEIPSTLILIGLIRLTLTL